MRLGIDAREIEEGVHTGIGHPLANFLSYFDRQGGKDTCVLFSRKPVPLEFSGKVSNVVVPSAVTFVFDQLHLPRLIKQENIDLFYSPYYKLPLGAACKKVSAILDLMYLVFEDYRREMGPLGRLYYMTMGKKFARSADKILTCSQYSKRDIISIYGIEEDKITVIPLSINKRYRPEDDPLIISKMKRKLLIPGPYILYVGNFKPHKNVAGIIEAFSKVKKDFSEHSLVLAGPKRETYESCRRLVERLSLTGRVIFTGRLFGEDFLPVLYSGADIFVMPSFYEGFGLPPVEAMACKTPVIASNTTAMKEVVNDNGLLVSPADIGDIASAMRRLLTDAALRENLREKGLHYAENFRSEKIARQTYEFFQSVLS